MGVCASTATPSATRLASFPPGSPPHAAVDAQSDDVGNEALEWLDVGLVNAFDDPPLPDAEEEPESVAGVFRPDGGGWRHSLPHAGAYTPLQWTRAPPCACIDWSGKRSQLCWCTLPAAFACVAGCAACTRTRARSQLLRVGEHAWLDALTEHMREHASSNCPHELRGWWWIDGDLERSGELVSFDGGVWSDHGERAMCTLDMHLATFREHTLAGYARAARAVLARTPHVLVWERSGSSGGGRFDRAYVAPGSVWLFRVAPDEFRVVEYDDARGATNQLRAMHRLRRVLRHSMAAGAPGKVNDGAGGGDLRKLAALAEYVARARAPPPHEGHPAAARCCGWAGAPMYGCGVGAAERVDNAVVPVNPLVHVMWRRSEGAVYPSAAA